MIIYLVLNIRMTQFILFVLPFAQDPWNVNLQCFYRPIYTPLDLYIFFRLLYQLLPYYGNIDTVDSTDIYIIVSCTRWYYSCVAVILHDFYCSLLDRIALNFMFANYAFISHYYALSLLFTSIWCNQIFICNLSCSLLQ